MPEKSRFSHEQDLPDLHQEEVDVPNDIDPPGERLKKMMEKLHREFLANITDTRVFSECEYAIDQFAMAREMGEMSDHDFVVEALKVMNRFAVPMTRSFLEKYGIEEFSLCTEDFDTVCLNFVHGKRGERMVIDPDSISEEMNELPMHVSDFGDHMQGTLEHTEDGRWYLKGRGDFGYDVIPLSADELQKEGFAEKAKYLEGKPIRALFQNGTVSAVEEYSK